MLQRLRKIVQDANTVTGRMIYQPAGGCLCAPGRPCCWFQLAFVGSVNILLAVGNDEVATLLVVGRRDCVAHQLLACRSLQRMLGAVSQRLCASVECGQCMRKHAGLPGAMLCTTICCTACVHPAESRGYHVL